MIYKKQNKQTKTTQGLKTVSCFSNCKKKNKNKNTQKNKCSKDMKPMWRTLKIMWHDNKEMWMNSFAFIWRMNSQWTQLLNHCSSEAWVSFMFASTFLKRSGQQSPVLYILFHPDWYFSTYIQFPTWISLFPGFPTIIPTLFHHANRDRHTEFNSVLWHRKHFTRARTQIVSSVFDLCRMKHCYYLKYNTSE